MRARDRLLEAVARIPVRIRVTVAFAAAMAVVLVALAAFLVLRLGSQLDAATDQGLRSRAADVEALVEQDGQDLQHDGQSPLTERGESIAQILDTGNRVIDAPSPLRDRSLLTALQLRAALRRPTSAVVDRPAGEDHAVRLLAVSSRAGGRRVVVVVGQSLEGRANAIDELQAQLLIGGPIALLLASLVAYLAISAALSPVRRMAGRAADIRHGSPRRRLPVPPATDEIALLGATLNEMLDRLEDAFERERTFVADASHELRTPLAILKAELEVAQSSARTVEDYKATVASAAEETDRLVRLAEDLLAIARVDQGRLPVQRTMASVPVLIDTVVGRFAARAQGRGVRLRAAHDETSEPVAYVDSLRLEQALGNLVDNALRFAAHDVVVSCERRGASVVIAVDDDGPGVPAEFAAHAFERFTRADAARTSGGAGLGLAIVDAIARAHGGEARTAASANGGARFEIELPLPARANP